MTNKEMIIKVLNGDIDIDDGGAFEEMIITYHINCPYRLNEGLCAGVNYEDMTTSLCTACKEEWLEKKCPYEENDEEEDNGEIN